MQKNKMYFKIVGSRDFIAEHCMPITAHLVIPIVGSEVSFYGESYKVLNHEYFPQSDGTWVVNLLIFKPIDV